LKDTEYYSRLEEKAYFYGKIDYVMKEHPQLDIVDENMNVNSSQRLKECKSGDTIER
jgi:hypothetical protein